MYMFVDLFTRVWCFMPCIMDPKSPARGKYNAVVSHQYSAAFPLTRHERVAYLLTNLLITMTDSLHELHIFCFNYFVACSTAAFCRWEQETLSGLDAYFHQLCLCSLIVKGVIRPKKKVFLSQVQE